MSTPISDPTIRLIVNADDFGLSRSVNEGILTAHHDGIVTSTTLLANGPAFDHAVSQLRGAPRLGVGVHLNILRGAPLNPPNSLPLLTRDGHFHLTLSRMIHTFRPAMLKEIEREYTAQIERVSGCGIAITHLDGEKHHQQFPPLFNLLPKLLAHHRIPAVRCAPEPPTTGYGLTKLVKITMLNLFIWHNRHLLRTAHIPHPNRQEGIAMTGLMDASGLKTVLRRLPPGISELCCHPGRVDADHTRQTAVFGSFYIDSTRETELKLLISPAIRTCVAQAGIRLITYRELSHQG
ncbi:MAG: ChbG/HpnK family deacetylase [Magnetococcus sp. YQC-9]